MREATEFALRRRLRTLRLRHGLEREKVHQDQPMGEFAAERWLKRACCQYRRSRHWGRRLRARILRRPAVLGGRAIAGVGCGFGGGGFACTSCGFGTGAKGFWVRKIRAALAAGWLRLNCGDLRFCHSGRRRFRR